MAWLKLVRSGQLPSPLNFMPPFNALPLRKTGNANRGACAANGQLAARTTLARSGAAFRSDRRGTHSRPAEGNAGTEEREQRQHEAWSANKARLRPEFEAFAAKFPPVVNDAMPFGIWLHLHSQNRAPSADDVPPENALGIIEFLQDYKRRRQAADYRMQRETPLNDRKDAGNPCRLVGEILKGMGAAFRTGNAFKAPDFPITACT